MNTLLRSALIALVLTSASASMAAPASDQYFTDTSKPHAGYAPNSPEGNRAFWDYQGRHGS